MHIKIYHNQYTKRTKLTKISVSKNNKFFIWVFKDNASGTEYLGFSQNSVYYGNKTHVWYSLLTGHFLPSGYTISFDNIIGKEVEIVLNDKNNVASIIPIITNTNSENAEEENEEVSEETNESEDLFS